jgi:hypothetical protein
MAELPPPMRKRYIGEGAETTVHRLQRRERSGEHRLVIKPFEYRYGDDHGFNAANKEELEKEIAQLATEYGEFIPEYRIVENPKHKGKFVLVQYFIEGPTGAEISVFDYTPTDFEKLDTQKRITQFVERLKENFTKIARGDNGILPDLSEGNLLLDQNEYLYLIDLTIDRYVDGSPLTADDLYYNSVIIAQLEVLSGRVGLNELRSDPIYADLFKNFATRFDAIEDSENMNELYSLLTDIRKEIQASQNSEE